VIDLPRLSAGDLDADGLDEAIRAAVESVPDGLSGKMVRLVVEDVQRALVRELDHRRIRGWKAEALHFHLDLRPPEIVRRVGYGAPMRRQTLEEQVEGWEPGQRPVPLPIPPQFAPLAGVVAAIGQRRAARRRTGSTRCSSRITT